MLTQTIVIVGQAVRIDGDMVITRSGGATQSFNQKWYRPFMDQSGLRRLAPDKRETCQNLMQMIQLTKFEKARMAYQKQYVAMAPRYLAEKAVNSLG